MVTVSFRGGSKREKRSQPAVLLGKENRKRKRASRQILSVFGVTSQALTTRMAFRRISSSQP
jgi:hypothetical protein